MHSFIFSTFFLKFALPVCQSRRESDILGSFFIPVYYRCDGHTPTTCWAIADTDLTGKYRSTVTGTIDRTEWTRCHRSTRHIVPICIDPEPWSTRGWSSEIPSTIFIFEYIVPISECCRCTIPDARGIIVDHFPTIRLITWEPEPIRISHVCHSFDSFSSEIDRFDTILWVLGKIYPTDNRREHSCYS